MLPILTEQIGTPFAWTSSDVATDDRWHFLLTRHQKRELRRYIMRLKPMEDTTRAIDHPPLPPAWQQLMSKVRAEVAGGFGFALLRCRELAAPVKVLETFMFAIGAAIGTPIPQNLKGERVARVEAAGGTNSGGRGYSSRDALPFHTDTSDVLVLACIHSAKAGGDTSLVNALSIYNGILAQSDKSLRILYRGFAYTYPEEPKLRTARLPVYSFLGGDISCRYLRAFIDAAAQNLPGSIDREEQEVLDEFDNWTANERLIVRLHLEHGDMLFLNNHTNLHSRTEFLDFEEPARQRLLLRLWLKVPGLRNVHPNVAAQMNRFIAAPQRPASTTDEV